MRLTPKHWEVTEQRAAGHTYATIALDHGLSIDEVKSMLSDVSHVISLQMAASAGGGGVAVPLRSGEPFERCGFRCVYGASFAADQPGAYKVSRGDSSNIIGATFFENLWQDTDAAFSEFMSTAVRDDFPHPFMYGES